MGKLFGAHRGFTFIEALVVITISIVLVTMLVGYTRTSERQIIFFKEHSVLVNALFRAKSFALETFQPQLAPGFTATERLCGWGVSFDISGQNNRYIIYRDIAPSSTDPCDNASVGLYNPATIRPEAFEVFELNPSVVRISCLRFGPAGSCTPGPGARRGGGEGVFGVLFAPLAQAQETGPGGGGPALQRLDIFFLPPDPQTIFHPSMPPSNNEAIIVLELADGSRQSEIKISRTGQISYD